MHFLKSEGKLQMRQEQVYISFHKSILFCLISYPLYHINLVPSCQIMSNNEKGLHIHKESDSVCIFIACM